MRCSRVVQNLGDPKLFVIDLFKTSRTESKPLSLVSHRAEHWRPLEYTYDLIYVILFSWFIAQQWEKWRRRARGPGEQKRSQKSTFSGMSTTIFLTRKHLLVLYFDTGKTYWKMVTTYRSLGTLKEIRQMTSPPTKSIVRHIDDFQHRKADIIMSECIIFTFTNTQI